VLDFIWIRVEEGFDFLLVIWAGAATEKEATSGENNANE
jgi:hypothetical protein